MYFGKSYATTSPLNHHFRQDPPIVDINEDFLTLRLPRMAIVSAPSDGALRLSLIILARCGSQQHTQASHKELASAGGWTMRTFQRHLASLISARWIRVQRLGPGEPAVLHLTGPLSQATANQSLTDPHQNKESPFLDTDSPHGESYQPAQIASQISSLSSDVTALRADLTTLAETVAVLRSKTNLTIDPPLDPPIDSPKNQSQELSTDSPQNLALSLPPPDQVTRARQTPLHNLSQGAVLLIQWIDTQQMSQRRTATKLGVHHSVVDRWLTGQRAPSTSQRKLLTDLTNIPASAWDTPSSTPPEK
jgi:hypothetical protein